MNWCVKASDHVHIRVRTWVYVYGCTATFVGTNIIFDEHREMQ